MATQPQRDKLGRLLGRRSTEGEPPEAMHTEGVCLGGLAWHIANGRQKFDLAPDIAVLGAFDLEEHQAVDSRHHRAPSLERRGLIAAFDDVSRLQLAFLPAEGSDAIPMILLHGSSIR